VADECGGGVVLCGEGVGGAECEACSAGFEGSHEVGGFGGDVEAGAEGDAAEGLFAGEAVADEAEDGHVLLSPFDAVASAVGELDVFDVVFDSLGHGSSSMGGGWLDEWMGGWVDGWAEEGMAVLAWGAASGSKRSVIHPSIHSSTHPPCRAGDGDEGMDDVGASPAL